MRDKGVYVIPVADRQTGQLRESGTNKNVISAASTIHSVWDGQRSIRECIRCSPWHLTWAPWHLIRKEARQRAKEIPRGPLRSLVVHVYFLWSGPNCQAKDFITPERRSKNVFAISKPLEEKKENSLLVVWCTFTIMLALSKWSFNFHQRAALRGDAACYLKELCDDEF